MSAPRFITLKSTMAPLAVDHVDTDQIIPAAYLKTTSREGLGQGLFAGWRFVPGSEREPDPGFVINRPEFADAQVLVAGENFGCGSSREHAPWALLDFGFRAVISSSFADIFRSNSLKNGLLPVEVPAAVRDRLMRTAEQDPTATVEIDLERQMLVAPDGEEIAFTVDPFSRRCLLDGVDTMGYLLSRLPQIEAWEATKPSDFDTRFGVGAGGAA